MIIVVKITSIDGYCDAQQFISIEEAAKYAEPFARRPLYCVVFKFYQKIRYKMPYTRVGTSRVRPGRIGQFTTPSLQAKLDMYKTNSEKVSE